MKSHRNEFLFFLILRDFPDLSGRAKKSLLFGQEFNFLELRANNRRERRVTQRKRKPIAKRREIYIILPTLHASRFRFNQDSLSILRGARRNFSNLFTSKRSINSECYNNRLAFPIHAFGKVKPNISISIAESKTKGGI